MLHTRAIRNSFALAIGVAALVAAQALHAQDAPGYQNPQAQQGYEDQGQQGYQDQGPQAQGPQDQDNQGPQGPPAVEAGVAPPAIPTYDQPECPGEGYIWTPGYWAWGGSGY